MNAIVPRLSSCGAIYQLTRGNSDLPVATQLILSIASIHVLFGMLMYGRWHSILSLLMCPCSAGGRNLLTDPLESFPFCRCTNYTCQVSPYVFDPPRTEPTPEGTMICWDFKYVV